MISPASIPLPVAQPKGLMLHIGCGRDYWEGYINIDLDDSVPVDLRCHMLHLNRYFRPGSVRQIAMVHSLNYLNLWQARLYFPMVFELLEPGGQLIMETVNLKAAAQRLLENASNLPQQFPEYFEGVRALHAFGRDHMAERRMFTPNAFSWSPEHLLLELESAGFKEIAVETGQFHAKWRDFRVVARKSASTPSSTSKKNERATGRILFVLDTPIGSITMKIRGWDYRECFEADGWTVKYVEIGEVGQEEILRLAPDFDIVYLLKIRSLELVRKLKAQGKTRVVFDLTDALWNAHHRAQGWQDLEEILENSDAIFSDNECVAIYGRRHNPNVWIIPPCSQVESFDRARAKVSPRNDGKVRIGWMGTPSTSTAILNIARVLDPLLEKYPDLELRLLGFPDTAKLPFANKQSVTILPKYDEEEMIREILQMDIGIFPPPLDMEDFRARGALKALLYMSGGIPCVCHRGGECVRAIQDGENGMLATTAEEWTRKLLALKKSPELRKRMGALGLESVRQNHSLQAVYERLKECMREVMAQSRHHPASRDERFASRVGYLADEKGSESWQTGLLLKSKVEPEISLDLFSKDDAYADSGHDAILVSSFPAMSRLGSVPAARVLFLVNTPEDRQILLQSKDSGKLRGLLFPNPSLLEGFPSLPNVYPIALGGASSNSHPNARSLREILLTTRRPMPFSRGAFIPPNSRRNLLIACTHFWPSIGGVESMAENLGLQFVQKGYQVDIATAFSLDRVSDHHRGIRIISLGYDSHGRIDSSQATAELGWLLESGHYDAAILRCDPLGWILWSLESITPSPRTQVLVQPIINRFGYQIWKGNSFFRRRLKRVLSKADQLISFSTSGQDRVYYTENHFHSSYIPNATRPVESAFDVRDAFQIPKTCPVFLHVANHYPVKNHLGLIRVMKSLSGDWRLVMVGHPVKPELTQAILREAASDPRIHMQLGWPKEKVAGAMKTGDVLLLASDGEGSPVSILEAMSHGLPWVATPTCGAANDHAGGIIAPLNEFPAVLSFLAAYPKYREALSRSGYEHWKTSYNWEAVGNLWEKAIRGEELPAIDRAAVLQNRMLGENIRCKAMKQWNSNRTAPAPAVPL